MSYKYWVVFFLGIFEVIALSAGEFYPGDIVKVKVWHNADLSGEYEIDKNGNITMPLIGEIKIIGENKDSLTQIVTNRLKEYIKDPYVEILPLHKVTVLGQVYKPGILYLSDNARIADAIASAGGNRENANLHWIYIKNTRLGSRFMNVYNKKELRSGDIVVVSRNVWPTWGEWGVLISIVSIGISMYNTLYNN